MLMKITLNLHRKQEVLQQAGQVKPSGDSTPTGEPNKADDQGTQIKPTSNQGTTATTNETGNQNQVVKQVILRTRLMMVLN